MLRTVVTNIRKSKKDKNISIGLPTKKKSSFRYRLDVKPVGKSKKKNEVNELQELIFGGTDVVLEKWKAVDSEENSEEEKDGNYDNATKTIPPKRKVAWMDEDDDELIPPRKQPKKKKICKTNKEYMSRLKSKFDKTSGNCSWANLDKKTKDDSDDDDGLLHRTGDFITADNALPKSILGFKKCKDLNFESEVKSKVTALQFHSHAQVALVGSINHRLELFQVDGKNNPKIQSLFFDDFPISNAHFSSNGKEVIVLSRLHGYFYYFDMIAGKVVRIPRCKDPEAAQSLFQMEVSPNGQVMAVGGRFGYIQLLTANTKEWIGTLKMNSNVKTFAFNADGSSLYSHGADGEVYIWDMNSRSLRHKFYDDGCLIGTAIAVSPNNQYLACGSDSGVVNIYDASSCEKTRNPTPLKAILNLRTKINKVKFNATSEILALSSKEKGSAVKLFHCRSLSVFANFPELNEKIMLPTSLDFSKNSGYFSLANHKGNAFLYRLKHYSNF